jgi:hypothetical protein
MLHVLFAGPYHFHSSADLFGDPHRARHHVGFEPAAEAAADQVIVYGDLVDRHPGRFRRGGLRDKNSAT